MFANLWCCGEWCGATSLISSISAIVVSVTEVVFWNTLGLVTVGLVCWANCTVVFIFTEETIWQTVTQVVEWDTVWALWAFVLIILADCYAVLFVRSVDTVHDAVTYCLVTDTLAIVTQETGTFGCTVQLVAAVWTLHTSVTYRCVADTEAVVTPELVTFLVTFVSCTVQETVLTFTFLAVDCDVAAWWDDHVSVRVDTWTFFSWDTDGLSHVLEV